MANFDKALTSGYILRLTVNVKSQDIALNTTTYTYSLKIIKGTGTGKWADGPHSWSVRSPGGTVLTSGSIGSYDFRNYSTLTLKGNTDVTFSGSAARAWEGRFVDNPTWGELGNGTASGTVTPPSIPLVPSSLTVTRVSDTQQDLAWSNGSTYTSVVAQRSTDGGAWIALTVPGGNISTFSDTTTTAGHKYDYRVAGVAGAGQSGWSNIATVYTSPAAPASATATRIGQDIEVDATGLPPYVALFDIEDNGTVVASGVSLPWTDVAPNPSISHTYKVRGTIGGLAGAWSPASNTVQLQAPPNPPTNLSPNGVAVDVALVTPLSWQHNPVDSSQQTERQIRHRPQGGGSWTTEAAVATSAQTFNAPIGFFGGVGVYEWQVQTRGADPGWSGWSATATVTLITAPTVAIATPLPIYPASTLVATWTFFQAESYAQSAWQAELIENGTVISNRSANDNAAGTTFSTTLQDEHTYKLRVRVNAQGVWSAWDEVTFTVNFLPPFTPDLSCDWIEASGAAQLEFNSTDDLDPAPNIVQLLTNPRLLGNGTWAETRRNYFTDPIAHGGWLADAGTGGSSSSAVTADPRFAVDALRQEWSVAPSGSPYIASAQVMTIPNGEIITVSYLIETDVVNASPLLTAASGITWAGAETVTDNGDGTLRVSRTGTSTSTILSPRAELDSNALPTTANHMTVGEWLIEVADEYRTFFCGDSQDFTLDPDQRQDWVGTANDSASVMEIEEVKYLTATNCIAGVSTHDGKRAVRVIPTDSSNDSYITLPNPSGLSGTVMGTLHLDSPLTGTLHANALSLGASTPDQLDQAANDAGVHLLREQFTVSAYGWVRLYLGAARGGGEAWWTDLGLFDGTYTGPTFNGEMRESVYIGGRELRAVWDGTPDDSTSSVILPAVTDSMLLERSIDEGATWEFISTYTPDSYIRFDYEGRSCGRTIYRVTALSSDGAPAYAYCETNPESLAMFVGGGTLFSNTVRLVHTPVVTIPKSGRVRATEEYEGRSKNVAYSSYKTQRELTITGIVFDADTEAGTRDRLEDVVYDPEPVHCFRDFYGNRYYGSLGMLALNALGMRPSCAPPCARGYWGFSIDLKETDNA